MRGHTAVTRRNWWHWLLFAAPFVAYGLFALRGLDYPGAYMDAANPDYMATWLARGGYHIPAWLYPDNFLLEQPSYPVLNSMYGGNLPAYLGLAFFSVAGFGLEQFRLLHALLGAVLLLLFGWSLRQWHVPRLVLAGTLVIVAVDPNFIFAWRTQYYLQLFPLIFFSPAIGLLGKHAGRGRAEAGSRRRLFLAGVFFGLAAYSYFIFFFYALALLPIFMAFQCKRGEALRHIGPALIGGTLIGWLPFLYGHMSMLIITDFKAYLAMLANLQSNYGVVDLEQGGALGRLSVLAERFGFLAGGSAMQVEVFGDWRGSTVAKALHILLLWLGPVAALVAGVVSLRPAKAAPAARTQAAGQLTALLAATLLVHVALGIAVGRPLRLQHYVMLTLVMYGMSASALTYLAGRIDVSRPVFGLLALLCYSSILISNISLSSSFAQRLKQGDSAKMYSDGINDAAAHLRALPPGTTVLFPQWGYWMGMLTITGPHLNAYEAASLDDMRKQLGSDATLAKTRTFVLVMGQELLKNGIASAQGAVQDFARQSELEIAETKDFPSRNGRDHLWLLTLSRRSVMPAATVTPDAPQQRPSFTLEGTQ